VAGNTATTGGPDAFGPVTSLGHNLDGVTDGSTGWVSSDLTGTGAAQPPAGPAGQLRRPDADHAPAARQPGHRRRHQHRRPRLRPARPASGRRRGHRCLREPRLHHRRHVGRRPGH
jgi:hypothetical protein